MSKPEKPADDAAALSALYRKISTERSPAALDARVLAAARSVDRPRTTWQPMLAMAASVVVAVSVGLQLDLTPPPDVADTLRQELDMAPQPEAAPRFDQDVSLDAAAGRVPATQELMEAAESRAAEKTRQRLGPSDDTQRRSEAGLEREAALAPVAAPAVRDAQADDATAADTLAKRVDAEQAAPVAAQRNAVAAEQPSTAAFSAAGLRAADATESLPCAAETDGHAALVACWQVLREADRDDDVAQLETIMLRRFPNLPLPVSED